MTGSLNIVSFKKPFSDWFKLMSPIFFIGAKLLSQCTAANIKQDIFHFFFDINIHRTLTLIVFNEQNAEILWVGNHDEYDTTFKGNKKTIETWLRNHGKIK